MKGKKIQISSSNTIPHRSYRLSPNICECFNHTWWFYYYPDIVHSHLLLEGEKKKNTSYTQSFCFVFGYKLRYGKRVTRRRTKYCWYNKIYSVFLNFFRSFAIYGINTLPCVPSSFLLYSTYINVMCCYWDKVSRIIFT